MLYITYYIEEFDGVGSAIIVHKDKLDQFFRDELECSAEFEDSDDSDIEMAVHEAVKEFKYHEEHVTSFSITLGGKTHHFEPIHRCIMPTYLGEYAYRALEGFINNLDN